MKIAQGHAHCTPGEIPGPQPLVTALLRVSDIAVCVIQNYVIF